MLDREFFKMGFEFVCILVVGMLLYSVISMYSSEEPVELPPASQTAS